MRIDSKRLLLGIMLIFVICIMGIAMSSAVSTITVTAKPSAFSDLPYKNYTKTWYNYCPLSHKEGTLVFNPKGTYEGELTCSYCGADYCAVTGKDKNEGGSRANLIPVNDKYSKLNIFMELGANLEVIK